MKGLEMQVNARCAATLTLAAMLSGEMALAQTPAAARTAAVAAAPTAQTDVRTYRSHIEFLANPFMEGRGPGTRGNAIAAEYIESNFRRIGLLAQFEHEAAPTVPSTDQRPVTMEETFRQEFQAGTHVLLDQSILGDDHASLYKSPDGNPGIPHVALGFSGSGSVEGPLVFVGYAIQEGGPDKSYSTFAKDDDLSGKIAVMFRFEPTDAQGKSRFRGPTDSGLWSTASAIAPKVKNVIDHHAAGLIIVQPAGIPADALVKRVTTEDSARWTQPIDIPATYILPAEAEKLLSLVGSKSTLAELQHSASEHGVISDLGPTKARLSVKLARAPRTTWNIAATLPGRGTLASQYIIIGAHFDHVGYGYTGGSRSDEYGIVHPGADDNASGASGLLLAAEQMKRTYSAAPADANLRSIMFVAFSAEEMGLIGSREFMKACPIEARNIHAMLNMDMIGRLRDDKLEISGTGTAEGFADLLKPLFDDSRLHIQSSPGGRGPSDHATFYGAGVPVLHFFTGMHDQYHTPRDTVDLINPEGAVKVVTLVCDIASTLASRPQQLAFLSTDKKKNEEYGKPQISLGGVKVRFGIAPGNYADGEAGILVGEVYPGTCAAEAGILSGDRLIRWNGKDIGDVQSWMELMGTHRPGDVVDVDVKRKGEELRVRATLKSRDQAPK